MDIILASSSRIRNYLMDLNGLPYRAVIPDIDEATYDSLPISKRVQEIARSKARTIAEKNVQSFVIGADTLTRNTKTGEIYTKPKNNTEHRQKALKLSGATVENITGVSLWFEGKELISIISKTKIVYQTFDAMTYERLSKNSDPLDRSSVLGTFVDSAGFILTKEIKGSYTGALGLPMDIINFYIDYLKHKI